MGHVTVLGKTPADALAQATAIAPLIAQRID